MPVQYTLALGNDEKERLLFRKTQIITSPQVALLIVKPSNSVPNANNSEDTIRSIVGRFEDSGWGLQALKVLAGGSAIIDRLVPHYPQPFFNSKTENIAPILSTEERAAVKRVWGAEALTYPIYHPVQMAAMGMGNYKTIAKVWHTGRGNDNALLDVESPQGINTITKQKHPRYGKRRLLLVQNSPLLPSGQPFFIVNGFAAELIAKFSREGERIVVMVLGQRPGAPDLPYLREHIVGATNPHHARPGTIRYDALHAKEFGRKYPVVSLDAVGIENNIVHLSESIAEAHREVRLWVPEVLWYPPEGPFAPDIPLQTWERLRALYLTRGLQAHPAKVSSPHASKLPTISHLPESAEPPAISVNMMAGGSGAGFSATNCRSRRAINSWRH